VRCEVEVKVTRESDHAKRVLLLASHAAQRAMKVLRSRVSGVVKRISCWQRAEIVGISDRRCATGRSATKRSNSAGYLTAGEHDPLPSAVGAVVEGCWNLPGASVLANVEIRPAGGAS
jgi:hypothetical protein